MRRRRKAGGECGREDERELEKRMRERVGGRTDESEKTFYFLDQHVELRVVDPLDVAAGLEEPEGR